MPRLRKGSPPTLPKFAVGEKVEFLSLSGWLPGVVAEPFGSGTAGYEIVRDGIQYQSKDNVRLRVGDGVYVIRAIADCRTPLCAAKKE